MDTSLSGWECALLTGVLLKQGTWTSPFKCTGGVGDLSVLAMLEMPTGGSNDQDSVGQSCKSGKHQSSGSNQKSFRDKRDRDDCVLGRTPHSRPLRYVHYRPWKLEGRLPTPTASGPESVPGHKSQIENGRSGPPDLYVQQQIVFRYKDPLVKAVDALVALCNQYNFIYAFLHLKLFPHLLPRWPFQWSS